MPLTITPTAALATVKSPQDMDALTATTGGANQPIQDTIQSLANRIEYALDSLDGLIVSRVIARSDGTTVNVQALHRATVGGKVHNTTTVLSYTPSGLGAAGTIYYLYVYDNAGTLALDAPSTTAPDVATGYTTKTGDATRRYVTCVFARDATHVYPFRASGGRYLFRRGADGLNQVDFRVLNAGNHTGGLTSVDWSKWAPPHAGHLLVQADFTPRTTTVDTLYLAADGDGDYAWVTSARITSLGETRTFAVEIPNTNSGTPAIQYEVNDTAAAVDLFALGFTV